MADAADNPLSKIAAIVRDAFVTDPRIAAMIKQSAVQTYDDKMDVRGDIEKDTAMGNRLWILPGQHASNLLYSSGSVQLTRRYMVGYSPGSMSLPECERLEWLIICAAALLCEKKLPQLPGTEEPPLPPVKEIAEPAPLSIESIGLGDTDPERLPLDTPQDWRAVTQVTVVVKALRSAIINWSET